MGGSRNTRYDRKVLTLLLLLAGLDCVLLMTWMPRIRTAHRKPLADQEPFTTMAFLPWRQWALGSSTCWGQVHFLSSFLKVCPSSEFRRTPLSPTRPRHESVVVRLNRLLFEQDEVEVLSDGTSRCILPLEDRRASHVARTLRLDDGDVVRVGVLDHGVADEAAVRWHWPAGSSGSWAWQDAQQQGVRLGNNQRPELGIDPLLHKPVWPTQLELTFREKRSFSQPRVDVLLAVQRPHQLHRMIPQLSSLGVGSLILVGTRKVEPSYFGSHLLRDPQRMREALVEGLAQCGDVHVPEVVIARSLRKFLKRGGLDEVAPLTQSMRLVGHPTRLRSNGSDAVRMHQLMNILPPRRGVPNSTAADEKKDGPRILVAVGPEGGWEDPNELELLAQHEFQPVTLGPRTLRSDVALNSLLALAHEVLCAWDHPRQQHL